MLLCCRKGGLRRKLLEFRGFNPKYVAELALAIVFSICLERR